MNSIVDKLGIVDKLDKMHSIVIGLDPGLGAGRQSYPPYDVINADDGSYVINVAAAGFSQRELSVTLVQGTIRIAGAKDRSEVPPGKYVHRGIAQRDFELVFQLRADMEIVGARFTDGVLSVTTRRDMADGGATPVPINAEFPGRRKTLKEG